MGYNIPSDLARDSMRFSGSGSPTVNVVAELDSGVIVCLLLSFRFRFGLKLIKDRRELNYFSKDKKDFGRDIEREKRI